MVFNRIVAALNEAAERDVLCIRQTESQGCFFVVQGEDSASSKSLALFKNFIGEERFVEICKMPEISLNSNTMPLTKANIRKIFVGSCLIPYSFLYRHNHFRSVCLFDNFEEFQAGFLGMSPSIDQFKRTCVKSSGKRFEGLIEKVYLIWHHFFSLQSVGFKTAELTEVEFLTARMGAYEFPEGSVIPLREENFYVDKVFRGGGAYVTLLLPCCGDFSAKIICRATALSFKAAEGFNSVVNNFLLEMGSKGVKQIWPGFSQYLKKKKIQRVEILGKGLGGVHAQLLAVLTEGVGNVFVSQLTTVCSMGVGEEINSLFKKEILQKRGIPFKLQIVRQMGDYVPFVGGVHLGQGAEWGSCERRVRYLVSKSQAEDVESEVEVGFVDGVRRLFSSFTLSHFKQMTLSGFYVLEVDDDVSTDVHLSLGNWLEPKRLWIVRGLHYLTLGRLNGVSFTSYFKGLRLTEMNT